MSKEWTNKEYWSQYWDKEKRDMGDFTFSELIEEYINFENVNSYMEIGGAPGSIMAFMHQKYGVQVNAVDFVDTQYIESTMKKNHITNYKIYEENFTEFDLRAHAEKYDLVASWGFVEHFDKDICREIIDKQKQLVSEGGGYLIIELPNLRKVNWLIYRLVNKSLLEIHNLEIMNLSFLKTEIEKGNNFEFLYCNYYLTSFLGFNSSNEFFDRHKVLKRIFVAVQNIFKKLKIDNIGTQFLSPYIVVIAKRKCKSEE